MDDSSDSYNYLDIYCENNHVYFYSEVTKHSIYKLITCLHEARDYSVLTSMKLNIDEIPIYLHINSNGGFVFAANSVIDLIMNSNVPIYSIIEGACASAATLISIVCKKRYIRPNSHMLVHQLSGCASGKMSEIDDEHANLTKLSKRMNDIYLEHTKMSKKTLCAMMKQDIWLDSSESIRHGLADELWTKF
jgi:ATP-dependent Clp endopeptidase proteolytic subunit ClpP